VKLPARLGEQAILKFSESLSGHGHAVSVMREEPHAPWILEWVYPEKPEQDMLIANVNLWAAAEGWADVSIGANDLTLEKIPDDADWLELTYKQFPPFSVGPFFIYGSHYKSDVPDAQIGLQIDAATAFGSGEHGTTKGCLMAMLDLKAKGACPWNILDMGTGSGILGIAAWKLWKSPVLAIDNDEESVRVACHHHEINKVPASANDFTCKHGDGFATNIIQEKKPYDLIIANILAAVLREMAEDLAAVSDSNGYVILSGILREQVNEVLAAYKNFKLRERYDIGEWSTLTLQNAAA
jgi:ribosomal protein L11 methyltransferase